VLSFRDRRPEKPSGTVTKNKKDPTVAQSPQSAVL
jgi:hypothetical protein